MAEHTSESPNPRVRAQLLRYVARWDQRLRFTQLTLWIPRGLLVGLAVGVVAAIVSRLRPLWLPNQVLAIAGLAALLGAVTAFVAVWLWPRPALRAARYFDRVFGLKERTSTALEIAAGAIKAPDNFAELQGRDALVYAAQVRARRYLPFQWRRYELLIAAVMAGLLVALLALANPQAEAVEQQAAIQAAIQQQIDRLEEIKRDIQNNPGLTEEQKAELSRIAESAIQKLEQPEITQPEAVAELSQAAQALNDAREKLTEQQLQALRDAGQALNQSQATQGVGQSMQSGNLSDAANQLQSLAQRVGDNQLTQEQLREMADALEQAAQMLAGVNPQAAQALRQAAQALRQGDTQAAQQALQQAAQALQNQQNQMNQSALTQQARQAAQQLAQGSNQLAQAGQPQNQQGRQQSQALQNSGQTGQMQNQQGQQQTGQGQNAQQGQQIQQGQQGQQQGQAGQQAGDQQGQQGQAGQQQGGAQGQQQGGAQQGGDQGGADSEMTGLGQFGGQQGSQGSMQTSGPNSEGAGQGSGGPGNDVTRGQQGSGQQIEQNNQRGSGNLVNNNFIYAPSFVGGEGGQEIDLDSDAPLNETDPLQQGNFTQNPSGESKVRLSQVAGLAAKQADQAMDNDRVPGALRGVIREYFSGLQQ